MKSLTFRNLERLREKYGPGIFGKITQKLLGLAFYEVGFPQVVERGVQGVDLDVANAAGEKYAVEVKTTDGDTVPISQENIEALKDRARDGYIPLIAALRIQLLEDWIIASIPLSQLQPGTIPLSRLRAYRTKHLETSVRPAFEQVVNEHFSRVVSGGEGYLIRLLNERRQEEL